MAPSKREKAHCFCFCVANDASMSPEDDDWIANTVQRFFRNSWKTDMPIVFVIFATEEEPEKGEQKLK